MGLRVGRLECESTKSKAQATDNVQFIVDISTKMTEIFIYYLVILSIMMESISLKLDDTFLKDIERTMKNNRYTTKTEFIREAIRDKIKQLEREEAIRKLATFKGSLKSKMSDEETGVIAVKEIAKKFGLSLD